VVLFVIIVLAEILPELFKKTNSKTKASS